MRQALAVFALLTATQAAADTSAYDGRYRPVIGGESWDCRTIGTDGGALAIANGAFLGVESRCSLRRPTNVRDMQATLFDMICMGEGETWTQRVMIMATPEGIAMVSNGGEVSRYTRCP